LLDRVTDPAEMTAAMLRMAGDGSDREQFSRNGEEAFHANFTLNAMAGAYMDLYAKTPRRSTAGAANQDRKSSSLT
jgi:glycosyltransferase involved in cell wall biosynthesis